MDAVTAAAGVSKQTIYRYYETKVQLFADVLTELVARSGPAPTGPVAPLRARTTQELEATLVSICERYLTRVMQPEQLSLLRIVIAEGSRVPDLALSFRSTVPAADVVVVVEVIESGKTDGLVADWVETRAAARALASLLLAFIFRDGLLAAEPEPPNRRQLAEMVHILVSGIAARPGPPASQEESR